MAVCIRHWSEWISAIRLGDIFWLVDDYIARALDSIVLKAHDAAVNDGTFPNSPDERAVDMAISDGIRLHCAICGHKFSVRRVG